MMLKLLYKFSYLFFVATRFQVHTIYSIANPSFEIEVGGELKNKGPEANPLNYAFDMDVHPFHT
jgi:hypothetical protein